MKENPRRPRREAPGRPRAHKRPADNQGTGRSGRTQGSARTPGARVEAKAAGPRTGTSRNAATRTGTQRAGHRNGERRRPQRPSRPAPRSTRARGPRDAERARLRKNLILGTVAIVLAVVALVGVVKYALSKIETHTTPVNPVAEFEPVACDADMLVTSVERTGSTSGKPVTFSASITNKGARPCFFDAAELRLQLTSGNQTVYDSQVCQAGPAAKLLLLDKGMTTVQALAWNGVNAGVNCQGTSVAGAGTYVARVFRGSQPLLETGHIFELLPGAKAPAKPTESAEPTQAEESPAPDQSTESTQP